MSSSTWLRSAAVLLLAAGAAGCTDELPTANSPDRFPADAQLTSAAMELASVTFLEELGLFDGYTRPREVPYHVVANGFEGVVHARALYRFGAFPETVTHGGTTDSVFEYTAGEVVAHIDSVRSRVTEAITLRLHEIGEAWDPVSANWLHAEDTADEVTPWAQPGGTLGDELSRITWTPSSQAGADTLRWQLDSLTVLRLAQEDHHGVIVVADGLPGRVQIGSIELRTGRRPESDPDTVVELTVGTAQRTFVYTPQPEVPPGSWMAGGITAGRTLLRIRLPEQVEACPPGVPAGQECPRLPIREVTLNEVTLLLEARPVRGGFRPLGPMDVMLRTVAEPELGRHAPLGAPPLGRNVPGFGPIFAEASNVPASLFAEERPDTLDATVALPLTDHFRAVLARDTAQAVASTAFALFQEPEGATFGHARFTATPRLRIVYTLPLQPTSP